MAKILSIVITYNAESWLPIVLNSLTASSVSTSIAVVDNASKDRTVEIIRERYMQCLTYFFPMSSNLGFGGAHNHVFEQVDLSNYEYVFLLNQDAQISNDGIGKLLEVALLRPDIGILSPMHYFSERILDRGFKRYLSQAYKPSVEVGDCTLQIVDFVNAAIWLIRSNVIQKVGGFDPIHFHYGEDRTFVNRSRYLGYAVGVVKEAEGYHYRDQQVSGLNKKTATQRLGIASKVDLLNPQLSIISAVWKTVVRYFREIVTCIKNRTLLEAFNLVKGWAKVMTGLISIQRSRSQFIKKNEL